MTFEQEISEILENQSFVHFSCGLEADPADGYGDHCTCGADKHLDQALASIKEAVERHVVKTLREIEKAGYDDMHGTFDYNRIAEALFEAITNKEGK